MKTQPPRTFSVGMTTYTSVNVIIWGEIEKHEGVEFNLVSFNGGNPARLALAGKHIDLVMPGLYAGQPIWEYVRFLAVAQPENLWKDQTDNAPTLNEAMGYELPNASDSTSLFVPAGFSKQYPARHKKFVDAFLKVLKDPDYLANLEKLGQSKRIFPRTPEESQKLFEEEVAMYKENLATFKKTLEQQVR